MKKYISWNVNGFRAVMNKNAFLPFVEREQPDAICLQETKMQEGQAELTLPGYHQYWAYAEKKGYSGTAVFTKAAPREVRYGIGIGEHDHEGRVIALDMGDFWFLTVYTPNSQDGLKRLDYRMSWEDAFLNYINGLRSEKPVVFCGDLNVAHQPIDLKNPSANHQNAGFTDQERGKFTALLGAGYVDSFRYLHPDAAEQYSWWSYRFRARDRNAGWRIDYFIVSEDMKDRIESASIHQEIFGSDHCPVELVLK